MMDSIGLCRIIKFCSLLFSTEVRFIETVKIQGLKWWVICSFWTNTNKVVGKKVSANFLQKYPIF